MRPQNIVLFSSGISEGNGILEKLKSALEAKGHKCAYWRDLFDKAKDPENIALLPMLIKKIPTFDFAVLICEGHDLTVIRRNQHVEEVASMRDNVLFEIGLSVMALGTNRTILVTDGQARLPDDLQGIRHSTAVKVVTYQPDKAFSQNAAAEAVTEIVGVETMKSIEKAAQEVDAYIAGARESLIPTVIGASVSTANGYVTNFILRLLEKLDRGVELDGIDGVRYFPDEKIHLHIVLPTEYSLDTPHLSQAMMKKYKKGRAMHTRFRAVEFFYELRNDELHIYDFPTTAATNYQTAKMILRLDADDTEDTDAEKRFNAKELDLFEYSIRVLLKERFIRENYEHFYNDDTPEEEERAVQKLTALAGRVEIERADYGSPEATE